MPIGKLFYFVPQTSNRVNAAGAAGDLAGTIATSGALTITAGGAGTNATGQFVSELSILH